MKRQWQIQLGRQSKRKRQNASVSLVTVPATRRAWEQEEYIMKKTRVMTTKRTIKNYNWKEKLTKTQLSHLSPPCQQPRESWEIKESHIYVDKDRIVDNMYIYLHLSLIWLFIFPPEQIEQRYFSKFPPQYAFTRGKEWQLIYPSEAF